MARVGIVGGSGYTGAELLRLLAVHPALDVKWATGDTHLEWGWPLAAALAYVAVGPAVIAYRSWGLGVQRVGPTIAGFFSNLTPLFAICFMTLAWSTFWPVAST